MNSLVILLKIIATALLMGGALYFLNQRLVAHYRDRPDLAFRRQLIQVGSALIAVLFIILFMPFGDVMRGQLLQLYGLIISATIALSSATLVGNIMAGLMLKTIGNCRPGNYIVVGDHFGRISEMDLLHTEIQTEERDLTTLPNLYLIKNPVRVLRSSGTLLSVDVSLGYEVSRHDVEELLIGAAKDTGLEKPYVQIRELGDYSVTYQVSALLLDLSHIIDKRRELRARTLDALHGKEIEVVSPTFMNTRSIQKGETFIARTDPGRTVDSESPSPDSIAFDKAERAESVSKLRKQLEEAETRASAVSEIISNATDDQSLKSATAEKENLDSRIERLKNLIDRKEAKISSAD